MVHEKDPGFVSFQAPIAMKLLFHHRFIFYGLDFIDFDMILRDLVDTMRKSLSHSLLGRFRNIPFLVLVVFS